MQLRPDAPLYPASGSAGPARMSTGHAADDARRPVLLAVSALAWAGSIAAWWLGQGRGPGLCALHAVLGANLAFAAVMFVSVQRRWVTVRLAEMACLAYATGACATCMVLGLYVPASGMASTLGSLYLWIPLLHVFAFAVATRRWSSAVALAILALFVGISLPYLWRWSEPAQARLTLQLHLVCVALVTMLSRFAAHRQPLALDELAALSHTDALTRLPNRRRLGEIIAYELARFARHGRGFAVIMIDVDRFADLDGCAGQQQNDAALRALAARLGDMLRDGDTLGRWDGDAFVAVLPEAGLDDALRKARALCAHVADMPPPGGRRVTISCGVTQVIAADTAESLLQRAGMALQSARRGGCSRAESLAAR